MPNQKRHKTEYKPPYALEFPYLDHNNKDDGNQEADVNHAHDTKPLQNG